MFRTWSSSRRPYFWLVTVVALLVIVLPRPAFALSSSRLVEMTNQQRTMAGLSPLSQNAELMKSAEAKAKHMLTNDYWAHESPDGTMPWAFIKSSGYHYKVAGENLAKDFVNDQAIVDAWMASPTHRANILKPEFRDIGIVVAKGHLTGHDTDLVVAHYGAEDEQSLKQSVSSELKREEPVPQAEPHATEASNTLVFFTNAVSILPSLIIGRRLVSLQS